MQAEPGELAGCRRPPLAPGPPPRAVLGERGAERELGPLPASKERKTLVPTSPHSLMGQERGRPCGRATRGGGGERFRPCFWPVGPSQSAVHPSPALLVHSPARGRSQPGLAGSDDRAAGAGGAGRQHRLGPGAPRHPSNPGKQ